MFDLSSKLQSIEIYTPTTDKHVKKIEEEMGLSLPKCYKELLLYSNGLLTSDGIEIFGVESIIERNLTYEVQIYAPGYVGVGSDGGGNFFLMLSNDNSREVLIVGCGVMDPEYAEIYTNDFVEWVNNGVVNYRIEKWRKEKEEELQRELCNLLLIKVPSGGTNDLKKIKDTFNIKAGLFDLLKGSKQLPFMLLKDVYVEYVVKNLEYLGELGELLEIVPTGKVIDRKR